MFLDGYMNHIYNAFLPHIACCCCCCCHPFSQSHYNLMCAWYGLATIRSCTSRRVVGPGRIRYLFYSLCKDQITNQPSHPIPSTIISLTEEGWNCVLLMVGPRQTYVYAITDIAFASHYWTMAIESQDSPATAAAPSMNIRCKLPFL